MGSGDLVGHLLALLAGTLTGAAYCCVRCLSQSQEQLWTLLALPLVSLPFCARDLQHHDATTWAWLLMLGICTQVGRSMHLDSLK